MQKIDPLIFSVDVPPDLDHAAQVREEALDWLETQYPGAVSFRTGQVLQMAGETGRRWLIARLRQHDIGNEEEFSLPAAADALTVLFLRSRGVKFREAVDAVLGRKEAAGSLEPRYGGIWNRLIVTALGRLRRRIPPRLLGSAVSALLRAPKDQPNCLIIVKRHGKDAGSHASNKPTPVTHDYVYRTILERPAPSCSVIAPSLEVLFLDGDQLATRSEVTSRYFVGLRVKTEHDDYELLLGTMRPVSVPVDDVVLEFVGRALDIVFPHFEQFHRTQASSRFETTTQPEAGSTYDLQLWLMAQFLNAVYPGSLCQISATSQSLSMGVVLASSATKPWEPPPWDPPKSLEMFSGYASRVGVPLVVERVEYPWTSVIESVESEIRYLRSRASDGAGPGTLSALALPVVSSSGDPMGSLYLLTPQIDGPGLKVEVRILEVFSLVVGEMIERQRTAIRFTEVARNIATLTILRQEQFKAALLDLLSRTAGELRGKEHRKDLRLPFLLLSAHGPESDEYDPAVSDRLKGWLMGTLQHLEWRSFLRSHWSGADELSSEEGFMGEVPGAGMMIAPGGLVSKDELDRIRGAFPTTINRVTPTNAPVKLVAWVLDVSAQRIVDAADRQDLAGLSADVEKWAFEVATVVDDVVQSAALAHDQGQWDSALRTVRRALQKQGARTNSYLRRIAADCSLSLGDWPSALKYAREAVALSRHEMGSGLVRSLCQEGDAHLCLGQPVHAWDRYSEAASQEPNHPLPPHYRGQALLLMARLLRVYEDEVRGTAGFDAKRVEKLNAVLETLASGAMEDLTEAADLLDRWGLIPEAYQYKNFHLIPTLMGLGGSYLLTRAPGPAASRLQSARRSFPKDDLFFREFLFAKCWEQGLHRGYGEMLLGAGWVPLQDRLHEAFGEPQSGGHIL